MSILWKTKRMNASEAERRQSNTDAVWTLFQAKPMQWIAWSELADVGGALAWRTRVSNARTLAEKLGGSITWNHDVRASAYRYLPYVALGPDPSEYRAQELPLFASEPSGWQR